MIHTVEGFGVVNKTEIDVFLELSCFFNDPVDIGNLISGFSAFSKTSLNIWKFSVYVLLKLGLEDFEHYFTSVCVSGRFYFLGSKITVDSDCSHEIKTLGPWKESYDKPRQHIEKQRYHFANKGPYSQSYGFSTYCGSVAHLCPTLCDPMNCSIADFPVPHHLPKFAQALVHCMGDAIQPSHPLMPSSPSALNLSQH